MAISCSGKRPARTLMVQGTASDVGKSLITAALCRIFYQDGWRVAPFKSQNMSLNSYVTPDGKEIGRAQGMQADACGAIATTDMNPILLKPKKDMAAQVVVHGRPYKDMDARAYREEYLKEAEGIVRDALSRLRSEYDLVILEGAGSPAEVNLKDRDIVNMRMAGWADAPVVLVADIDRGGVFASLVGTLEILTEEERDRVQGFIINKFRGDVSLLQPGLDWLEKKTGKPVLGVIPYLPDLALEDEDSASLDASRKRRSGGDRNPVGSRAEDVNGVELLDIAVIRLPRMSNFTDFDPLREEDDVRLRYVEGPGELGNPDAVILPGSKNTTDDLEFLRESGLEACIRGHVEAGGALTGICGGYQMMGRRLIDPDLLESDRRVMEGMGYFPTETRFVRGKRVERVAGFADFGDNGDGPFSIEGYEIHMGHTAFLERVVHLFRIRSVRSGGMGGPNSSDGLEGGRSGKAIYSEGIAIDGGRLWGTYIHGVLHNDGFRRAWLNRLRRRKGWEARPGTLLFGRRREEAFDRLADHVRAHLDLPRVYEMMGLAKQGIGRNSL